MFLFLNSVLGAPLWPSLRVPEKIQLDGVLWATLNLYVHVSTVVRLLNDERQAKFKEPEHEALWRMFYRTGGLSQQVFTKTIGAHCTVVRFTENEIIDTEDYFYIIYKGTVKITVRDERGSLVSTRKAQSGQLFDFRALGLLQDMQSSFRHHISVESGSQVVLFQFPRKDMARIASHPSTRLMWKELLMENLLRIVVRYFDKRIRHLGDDRNYTNPIFLPLQKWEEPLPLRAGSGKALRRPLDHILASMQWSFTPPWPWKGPLMGLRHQQLPAPGRIQDMPPKRILVATESRSLLPTSRPGSPSINSRCSDANSYNTFSSEEDELLECVVHEVDPELGGLQTIAFK